MLSGNIASRIHRKAEYELNSFFLIVGTAKHTLHGRVQICPAFHQIYSLFLFNDLRISADAVINAEVVVPSKFRNSFTFHTGVVSEPIDMFRVIMRSHCDCSFVKD